MNKNIILIAVGLIVCLGLFWLWQERDTRRLNKRLDQLTAVIEKTGGESHLVTMAKSQSLVAFFTPDAVLRLSPLIGQQLSRRELSSIFYQVHARLDRLSIRIMDKRLDVDRSAGRADMRFTTSGHIEMVGQRDSQMHEFHLEWIKVDGEWYVDRASIVQGIRPPRTPMM